MFCFFGTYAKHKSDTNSKSHTHTFTMESHFKKLTLGYKDVPLNRLWCPTLKIQIMRWGNLNQVCVCAQSLQSCLILCDPVDCSPPDSSVRGILWARILEWVAMPSSRGSSQPRYWTHISFISWIGRWILYPLNHLESTVWILSGIKS